MKRVLQDNRKLLEEQKLVEKGINFDELKLSSIKDLVEDNNVVRKTECDVCSALKVCKPIYTYNVIWVCNECALKGKEEIKSAKEAKSF